MTAASGAQRQRCTRQGWRRWTAGAAIALLAACALAVEIDPVASHASWMENFTWTRLAGVTPPSQQKPMIDFDRMRGSSAQEIRVQLGDGNFGGYYEKSDDDMAALWAVAVEETRALIDTRWE